MKIKKLFAFCSAFALLISMTGVFPVAAASGIVRQVPNGGTTSPVTGEFVPSGGDGTQMEFPEQEDEPSAEAFNGTIINRSLSPGVGGGANVTSGKKAQSNPQFNNGFEGLNFYQQRYARGGNQFSVEPPD